MVWDFSLAKMVGFGFSVSAMKIFQFGSRDDGEVADFLFGDGDEDMVVML